MWSSPGPPTAPCPQPQPFLHAGLPCTAPSPSGLQRSRSSGLFAPSAPDTFLSLSVPVPFGVEGDTSQGTFHERLSRGLSETAQAEQVKEGPQEAVQAVTPGSCPRSLRRASGSTENGTFASKGDELVPHRPERGGRARPGWRRARGSRACPAAFLGQHLSVEAWRPLLHRRPWLALLPCRRPRQEQEQRQH